MHYQCVHVCVTSKTTSRSVIIHTLSLDDLRTCEYDDETLEFWVNTRTEGELTKEDLEEISRARKFKGMGGSDVELDPMVKMDGLDFSRDTALIHRNAKAVEGDHVKSAP